MRGYRPRHKFNAVRTLRDGFKFDSKMEARYYDGLKLRCLPGGDVVFFMRQVPFYLPGNVRYVVDFLEFHTDGTVHFVDVKGTETETFKVKKKLVEHHFPVKIETVQA